MIDARRPLQLSLILLFLLSAALPLPGQQSNQDAIRRYSQQAARALEAKNADAAVAALEALSRLTPNDPAVDANLGTVYYMQGRYKQASERFRRALKLNPQMPGVRPLLGICYAELGQPQEAIPLLGPAFRRPPNEAVGRLIGIELMDAYHSLNDNFEALEVSEELLRRYPNDPEILYRAAHLYGDRSLQVMARLVKMAPNSPWKRMAFAEALEEEKHYALAIIEYRKVIAADPNMPDVHYRLGRALLLTSKPGHDAREEALKEFDAALVQDPRNFGAEYEIGRILRRRGEPDQAAVHFSRAVAVKPDFEDAQIGLASALLDLHKPEEALPHLRTAVHLNPTNATSHFLLARAYKSLGNETAYAQQFELYQKYAPRPGNDAGHAGPHSPATQPFLPKPE